MTEVVTPVKVGSKTVQVAWTEAEDSREWDEFVSQNGGSFFQLWAWPRVLEYGDSKALYLACRDSNGRIVAACPFLRRTGRRFIYLDSLPDSFTAGPVVSTSETDATLILAKLPRAVRFSLVNPVVAMTIRTHQQRIVKPMLRLGFGNTKTRGLLLLNLKERMPEHIWSNGFKKHDRQAIKYYEKAAAFVFVNRDKDYSGLRRPDWKDFRFQRLQLSRPDYLSRMRTILGDRLKVALITGTEGEVLAGFAMLLDPPTSPRPLVHLLGIKHASSNNIHSVVTFINWKAINWAYENGFQGVDFGPYPLDNSTEPTYRFYKLMRRFELELVPRYEFMVPTSNALYSVARRIKQM